MKRGFTRPKNRALQYDLDRFRESQDLKITFEDFGWVKILKITFEDSGWVKITPDITKAFIEGKKINFSARYDDAAKAIIEFNIEIEQKND